MNGCSSVGVERNLRVLMKERQARHRVRKSESHGHKLSQTQRRIRFLLLVERDYNFTTSTKVCQLVC